MVNLFVPYKYFIFICCIFFSFSSVAQWERKQDGLIPRSEVTSIIYQDKIYTFFGFRDSLLNFVEPSAEVYEPLLSKWTLLDSMPSNKAVTHAGITVIDDNVWHIGGRVGKHPGPLTSEIWIYNITLNSWFEGPKLTDPVTGNLIPWAAGGAALLGRTLHVFGGFITNACGNDQSTYHLTLEVDDWLANSSQPAKWKNELAPLPIKRNHFSTVVLGGKIYAIGGQFGHDCGGGEDKQYSHVYDRSTNIWTELPLLPTPRSHTEGSIFAIDGKIYVVGGQATYPNSDKVTIFDPAANNGTGAWKDDLNLTLPKLFETLSAKVAGNNFVISHGGQPRYNYPAKATYTRTISRNPQYKLGFLSSDYSIKVDSGKITSENPLLFTIDGTKEYILSSNSPWLTITKNSTGTAIPTGVDIEITINTTGMAPGIYSGIISANGTGDGISYSSAEFKVNLTVQPPSNVLEAEDAFLYQTKVAAIHAGYTGSGFVDYVNSSGDYIEWTSNQTSAGSASLEFRYANGSTSNRPLKLEVNGVEVASLIDFPPTGSWSTWSSIAISTTVNAGANKVKLSAIGSSGGNIDHLKVIVVPNDLLEAEKASLYGTIVASNHIGFTGTGFVDYVNSSGDYIEWLVNQPQSVSASLEFRYANGSTSNRPLKLEVNGAVVTSSLNFEPTGGWSTWSTSSAAATLQAGINTIKLTAIGSSGGNIDHLKVIISNKVLEAEDASHYRAVVASNHAGFTGTGFVDYVNNSDDFIEWTANHTVSDAALLQFRYANGSLTNRPLKLEVNGVVVTSSLDFPPTGSWSTWSTVSIATNLNLKTNIIRLTAIGSSGSNIDNLIIGDYINSIKNAFETKIIESIDQTSNELKVTIAPNPATDNMRVSWKPVSEAPIEISLVDVQGIVHRTVFVTNSSRNYYNLMVRQYPAGLYIIKIKQAKVQSSAKILIKRN